MMELRAGYQLILPAGCNFTGKQLQISYNKIQCFKIFRMPLSSEIPYLLLIKDVETLCFIIADTIFVLKIYPQTTEGLG